MNNNFTLALISKTKARVIVYYYYKNPCFPDRPLTDLSNRIRECISTKLSRKEALALARVKRDAINDLLLSGWNPYQADIDVNLRAELDLGVGIQEAIDIAHRLVVQQYKESTHTTYNKIIKKFTAFMAKKYPELNDICRVEKTHVMAYLDSLTLNGLTAKTRNCHSGAIRTYFDLLLERELVKMNPAVGIKWQKINKEKNFKHHKIEDLKTAQTWLEENDYMTYVYYQLIQYCYIRPSELRLLKIENVDLTMSMITPSACDAKNSDAEGVYIPKFLLKRLKKYLKSYGSVVPGHFYLFTNNNCPGPIIVGHNLFRNRFNKMRKATGLSKDLKLYGLKGTGAKMAAKAGVNILFLKDQLRHKSLDMTHRYLGRYYLDEQQGKMIDKLNAWEKQA